MNTQTALNTRIDWHENVRLIRCQLQSERFIQEMLDDLACMEDRWRDEA